MNAEKFFRTVTGAINLSFTALGRIRMADTYSCAASCMP
jgi:hypothetical protein